MIHVFVGTKAQLIKMAPIMLELDRRGVAYNFIDSGQHAGSTRTLIEEFGLRDPDVVLAPSESSVSTMVQALVFSSKMLQNAMARPRWMREYVFRGEGGTCLIHGDTLTTLLSLVYGKRAGMHVWHVEAGYRSHHPLDPFPEEIIRLVAMRFSSLLFAPTESAMENLVAMGYESKSVQLPGNTIIDALRHASESPSTATEPSGPYVVATVHRVETIYRRSRQEYVSSLLMKIARDRRVVFPLHEVTRIRLQKTGLLERIMSCPEILVLPLQPYLTFIKLIAGADFVVTDGGSVQEECYYLDVPCLVVRSRTERDEGLGRNAMLAGFREGALKRFLENLPASRRSLIRTGPSPSAVIVDRLLADQ